MHAIENCKMNMLRISGHLFVRAPSLVKLPSGEQK